jgi:hypothetical protein
VVAEFLFVEMQNHLQTRASLRAHGNSRAEGSYAETELETELGTEAERLSYLYL